LNLQTELREKRIAQLKVQIESDVLEKAKREAARNLSKRFNIPGFRKGKAPYQMVVTYLGDAAIMEEAIDVLGPKVYKEALDQAELEPYGPGQLENIEGEKGLTLTFSVPLTPVVNLGDYRSLRHEYTAPEVTDERVEEALNFMVSNRAPTSVKEGPAVAGDGITIDLHGTLKPAEGETPAEGESEEEPIFDQHGWQFVLGETIREPMPGFSAAVEGISAGETRTFELTFPSDSEDYDAMLHGRTVSFEVTCHEVSGRQVPELNDDFVKSLEQEGVETVEALRAKVRADLEETITNRTENEYASTVLDKLVEMASIEYPDAMVEDQIAHMLEDFKHQLSQQGMTLENFLKLSNTTEEDVRNRYRESAEKRIKRSLVLGELFQAEKLEVKEAHVTQAVKERAHELSRGNDQMRELFEQYLSSTGLRDLAIDLMTRQSYDRLIAIAKGEEPPIGPVAETVTEPEVAAPEAQSEEPVAEAPAAEATEPAAEPPAEEA
jgi:trigger factor